MAAPHLLILDEPDQYLDIDKPRRPPRCVHDYEGAVIPFTHDRLVIELVAGPGCGWRPTDTFKPFAGDTWTTTPLRPWTRQGGWNKGPLARAIIVASPVTQRRRGAKRRDSALKGPGFSPRSGLSVSVKTRDCWNRMASAVVSPVARLALAPNMIRR